MSLDLLGAEGLSAKYITLRIKNINAEKLKAQIGGTVGSIIPGALSMVNEAPDIALAAALPIALPKLRDLYGIDLEAVVSDAPAGSTGIVTKSNFTVGVASGVGITLAGLLAWRWAISPLMHALV